MTKRVLLGLALLLLSSGVFVAAQSKGTPPPPPNSVTLTAFTVFQGTVDGYPESNPNAGFRGCSTGQSVGSACKVTVPSGAALIVTAHPGTVPGTPPFGKSRQAQFDGWSGNGCSGMPQGPTTLRIVANGADITCTAKFK